MLHEHLKLEMVLKNRPLGSISTILEWQQDFCDEEISDKMRQSKSIQNGSAPGMDSLLPIEFYKVWLEAIEPYQCALYNPN